MMLDDLRAYGLTGARWLHMLLERQLNQLSERVTLLLRDIERGLSGRAGWRDAMLRLFYSASLACIAGYLASSVLFSLIARLLLSAIAFSIVFETLAPQKNLGEAPDPSLALPTDPAQASPGQAQSASAPSHVGTAENPMPPPAAPSISHNPGCQPLPGNAVPPPPPLALDPGHRYHDHLLWSLSLASGVGTYFLSLYFSQAVSLVCTAVVFLELHSSYMRRANPL